MDKERYRPLFDPFHQPATLRKRRPPWIMAFLAWLGIFGLSFSLTCLYVGMRGIMRLGGFVASGGPYAIAHPAPRYVWVIPVSIWVGLICVFLHAVTVRPAGGLNLAPLAWPALFISLGWNFLEFAFHPPGGGSLAWGWLVCGIVFWLMGFVPLVLILLYARQKLWEDRTASRPGPDAGRDRRGAGGASLVILVELALVALGIYLAILFFASLTKA